MQILLLIKRVLTLVSLLTLIRRYDAMDWNCPGTDGNPLETTGIYTLPDDCILTNEIVVSGNLEITGTGCQSKLR